MELRHLRYFVAVAEELNFSRAAARLHTSQPSLSQQIRQLEAAVGVASLERSRHHVALTSGGRIFLREAKDILGRIERAGRLARQASDGRAGDLSIGTFPAADVRILPALRPLIARRLPHLRNGRRHPESRKRDSGVSSGNRIRTRPRCRQTQYGNRRVIVGQEGAVSGRDCRAL